MSLTPTTSPASAASAWPICMPNIAEPSWRAMPMRGAIIARVSGGVPSGSIDAISGGSSPGVGIADITDCTCSAIGPTMRCHAG